MARKSLHEVYHTLLDRVYTDDIESQMYYQDVVQTHRNISVDYLQQRGCLFIPNNEYIRHYIGEDANTYGCELYIDETCLWTLFFLIPILDLAEDVVGLVGWDLQNKYLEASGAEQGLPMYKVSSKNVFAREKFFLADIPLLKKTFDTRTIFITDGVFDSMALNYRGIPAIALLGSTFSREVLFFLRWYNHVYVCADNDAAGVSLYRKLSRALPRVHRVIQSGAKDIEEFLRSEDLNGPRTMALRAVLGENRQGDLYLR